MSDDRHTTQPSRLPAWHMLLSVLLLYLLSTGPLDVLIRTGVISRESYFLVPFEPIRWLHAHTPLEKPLEWYVAPWR